MGAGRRGRATPGGRRRGAGARGRGFPILRWQVGGGFLKAGVRFHLPPTSAGPRRPCPRNSWMNSRSAFVDTGVSSLPPARSQPTGSDRSALGGLPSALLPAVPPPRESAGQGRDGGPLAREESGRWPAAGRERGAPSPRPLPVFPKLGAPRAPIPVTSLNCARPSALLKAAHREPGPSLGRGRAEGVTGPRAQSRRRPFALGPGARPRPSPRPAASSSARTAPIAAGLRRHSPRARSSPAGAGLAALGPRGHLPAAPKPQDPPPRPLPKKCRTWEMGTYFKSVVLLLLFFLLLRLTLF